VSRQVLYLAAKAPSERVGFDLAIPLAPFFPAFDGGAFG
jgi:hypothetical protein